MLMSDQEVEERLKSPDNLVNRISVLSGAKASGRSEGSVDLTEEQRFFIGSLARGGEGVEEIAEEFGVAESTVSKSSRGLVHNRMDKQLEERVGRVVTKKADAHEGALDVLMESIKGLKDKQLSVKENIKVASTMARVVSSLEGQSNRNDLTGGNKVQVNVFMPKMKEEKDYEIVSAS